MSATVQEIDRSRLILTLLLRSGLDIEQIDVESLRELGDPPFEVKFVGGTMPMSEVLKALLPDAVMFQENGKVSFRRLGDLRR